MAAKSYLAPEYAQLSSAMEGKYGLPSGLLHAIVTKGERSNADQVSEAGAKTVFQITPGTRKAALEKYGVDAYLSAENAAEVAARLLKDSLDRNGGDVKEAIGEYHGGTDRKNWGPRTKAYVGRVSTYDRVKAERTEEAAPAAPSIAKVFEAYKAGSMSPAEKAEFEADVNSGAIILPRGAKVDAKAAPHVLPAGVVEAYNSHSEMTDGDRAQIDKDIAAGLVAPPAGAKLTRPGARSAGEMFGMGTRSIVEGAPALLDIGLNPVVALANTIYKPIGAITEAMGGTPEADLPYNQFRTAGKTVADAAGLAEPGTKQEKLAAAAVEGGAQGVLTAGAGMAGAGLKGATGIVARELAASPVADIAGSAAAAGAGEKARQEGVGELGQLAIAFGAGVPTAMGTKRLAQIAERFGPKAAKVVETTPREVMLDEKGALTEEGREVAARNDLKADDVKAAYEAFEKPDGASEPLDMSPDARAVRAAQQGFTQEALHGTPNGAFAEFDPAKVGSVSEKYADNAYYGTDSPAVADSYAYSQFYSEADLADLREGWATTIAKAERLGVGKKALSSVREQAAASIEDMKARVAQSTGQRPTVMPLRLRLGDAQEVDAGGRYHYEVNPEALATDKNVVVKNVRDYGGGNKSPNPDPATVFVVRDPADARSAFDEFNPGGEARIGLPRGGDLKASELPEPPRRAPEAVAATTSAADAPLPASAAARTAEAASEGVSLTKGQATKDFEAQSAEQDLAGTQSPEGQKVRDHFAAQAEQIKGAVDRFKSAIGDQTLGATERGQMVKDAVRDLRDQGKAGVKALYDRAAEMAEALGEAGSNLIRLDTSPILQRMREIFIDEGVDEGARKALKQQAAKYGLIGENPRTVEGETTVTLRDTAGEQAGKVTFTGPPQELKITNAEGLRQFVNAQFQKDTTGALQSLKPLIDDAVAGAVERAATTGPKGVGEAFQAARAGAQEQFKTFKSGDVVQDLIDWKKGQRGTEKINPEDIFKRIFAGGREGVTNLKKVKAVLLNKPTDASRAAWSAIQAHGVADIFNKATVVNANLGEAGLGAISGAKLNSEIARFGADKLKVLLSPEDFNQLMKLKRVISDATIPLKGTVNPSGSGHLLTRFFAKQAQNLAPVAKMLPFVRPIVQGAEEHVAAQASKKAVEGVVDFTPAAAAKADAAKVKAAEPKADRYEFIRRYLKVAGSDEIIAPVMAAAANEDRP